LAKRFRCCPEATKALVKKRITPLTTLRIT
jgi:hypothetical protein